MAPEPEQEAEGPEMNWHPVILINLGFMCASLYMAFGKRFRPISWSAFYANLGAAAVNAIGVVVVLFRDVPVSG